jgi:3',5'-cyclic AMP phosphodiesterase CpdA
MLCGALFASCEIDYAGLFYSEELDERLTQADSFPYLDGHGWRTLDIGSASYSFLFITDVHVAEDDSSGFENLKNLKKRFIASDRFVVAGGDLTQSGTRNEIALFIQATETWHRVDSAGAAVAESMPCYMVIGNHDIFFGNWSVWKELVGSTRYRIDTRSDDAGGATLLVLDTANAYFGSNQLDWLDAQLKRAQPNTFIFAHGTLFVNENPFANKKSIPLHERARIVSLIDSSPAKAYFAGHLHQRVIKEIQNKQYITLEDFRSHQNFVRVFVSPAGVSYSYF